MRRLGKGSAVAILMLVAGCVTVPPLQEDGIAIGQIVERVKCEIAFAVPAPQPPYPTGRYQWMRYWTAKVDLTLIANSRSTVTPTATFIDPLPTAVIPGVGNIQRNITLGLGAGLETQAERTEVLSFSLSLAEMQKYRWRAECDLPNGRGLYGNLGLREWVESALGPVDSGLLRVGRHPRVGAKSPDPYPVVPRKVKEQLLKLDPLADLKEAKKAVVYYAKVAQRALDRARQSGSRDSIQATYDDAGLIYGAEIKAKPKRQEVKKLVAELRQSEPDRQTEIEELNAEATKAGETIDGAKNDVDGIIKELPRDPPIDSLSHSVKFVVAVSGSLSPNWTLVNFRGPTTSGTLLGGSHTRTHTLSIAIGSPAEQARVLQNLVLQGLR